MIIIGGFNFLTSGLNPMQISLHWLIVHQILSATDVVSAIMLRMRSAKSVGYNLGMEVCELCQLMSNSSLSKYI
jgi:hypothetical protein